MSLKSIVIISLIAASLMTYWLATPAYEEGRRTDQECFDAVCDRAIYLNSAMAIFLVTFSIVAISCCLAQETDHNVHRTDLPNDSPSGSSDENDVEE